MNFAKLFQVEPDIQVVVLLKIDENEEVGSQFRIEELTDIQNVIVNLVRGFPTERLAKKTFDEYILSTAKEWIINIKSLLEIES